MTPYGRSKLDGERVVRSTPGLRWTILRPGVVYGPGDRGLLPLFQWAARGDSAARRPLGMPRTPSSTSATSSGRSMPRIGGDADGQVFFVGHPRIVTIADLDEAAFAPQLGAVEPSPCPCRGQSSGSPRWSPRGSGGRAADRCR